VIAEPASVDVVPDRLPVEPQDLHDLANRQELVGHDAGQTDGSLHDRQRPDGEGVQLVVDLLTIVTVRVRLGRPVMSDPAGRSSGWRRADP
jgi:hypothetical protein